MDTLPLPPPPPPSKIDEQTPPVTPTTPSSPARKSNPLTDLIDSEKSYVDHLTGIIRKVAAAWSRSNLPPPDLDTMFRSIEAIYKASRTFHSKLRDLGTNPSSPKALGDLLMRWIDDLKGPYSNYCAKYQCGFDTWSPIRSNAKLTSILAAFSSSNPPPASAIASNALNPPVWTLDDLFLLPKARLKYYKKLYGRLLKSTAPGKSDHKLLIGALETLDLLLATLESRSLIKVGEEAQLPVTPLEEPVEEVVIDLRTQSVIEHQNKQIMEALSSADTHAGSETSSVRDSSVSGGRVSRETTTTSLSRISSSTLSMPISELERRLSTQRTLDIFTMKPKARPPISTRSSMAPNFNYRLELRVSADAVIRFTSQATGAEVVHRLGHIYLLSDLFLVADKMTPDEKALHGHDGADMWLSYPPLAGKVLRVFEIPEQPKALRVVIMRKETLFLELDSLGLRNTLFAQFRECIEFSQSLPPASKVPPPPVPPLNGIPRGLMNPGPAAGPSSTNHISSRSPSPPSKRSSEQHYQTSGPPISSPPPYHDDRSAADSFMRLSLTAKGQQQGGPQRLPSINNPFPALNGNGPAHAPIPSTSFGHPVPGAGPPGPPRLGSGDLSGPPGPGSVFANHGPSGHPVPGPGSIFPGPSVNLGPVPLGTGGPGLKFGPGPGPGRGPSPGGPPQMAPNGSYGPTGYLPGHNQHRTGPSATQGSLPPNPYPPSRPPSEPGLPGGPPLGIRKSPSGRSLASQHSHHEQNQGPAPPMPAFPGGHPPSLYNMPGNNSYNSLPTPQPRLLLPSLQAASRSQSMVEPSFDEPSPPNSPVQETPPHVGPVTSTISAQMKCKVFLQQQHAQWKSLGSAKLKLYRQDPTNIKQLVVEAENKEKSIIISTIVLTDGVERVGKTGVAIELSDKGQRTGIIYMIQLRNESSAGGLFDSLLQGSDRAARG
ncbi:hypothetical protein H0H93_005261 [Arthromyces matolae]|nr:hypothetical protein H0H93_005261 [Arthromyces matolae]